MLPQAQEHQEPAEDGEQGQGRVSLGVTGGSIAYTHLGFQFWPLDYEGIIFCCFEVTCFVLLQLS